MINIIVVLLCVIAVLAWRLVKVKRQLREATTLADSNEIRNQEGKTVNYRWKLDSPKKTWLKGDLTLTFDEDEIATLRADNPYHIPNPNWDNTTCVGEMYNYMLKHPRTFSHLGEVVKYINRECSRNMVDELDKLQFTLDFVQEPNIRYMEDENCREIQNRKEYVRFPDETLYDRQGDCDCKSFLATMLFHVMGYNVLYLMSHKHAHAAICIEYDERWRSRMQESTKLDKVLTEIEGRKYVYCETTADGFRIGGIARGQKVEDFDTRLELRS